MGVVSHKEHGRVKDTFKWKSQAEITRVLIGATFANCHVIFDEQVTNLGSE